VRKAWCKGSLAGAIKDTVRDNLMHKNEEDVAVENQGTA